MSFDPREEALYGVRLPFPHIPKVHYWIHLDARPDAISDAKNGSGFHLLSLATIISPVKHQFLMGLILKRTDEKNGQYRRIGLWGTDTDNAHFVDVLKMRELSFIDPPAPRKERLHSIWNALGPRKNPRQPLSNKKVIGILQYSAEANLELSEYLDRDQDGKCTIEII
jgi:hypothetical protein